MHIKSQDQLFSTIIYVVYHGICAACLCSVSLHINPVILQHFFHAFFLPSPLSSSEILHFLPHFLNEVKKIFTYDLHPLFSLLPSGVFHAYLLCSRHSRQAVLAWVLLLMIEAKTGVSQNPLSCIYDSLLSIITSPVSDLDSNEKQRSPCECLYWVATHRPLRNWAM